MTNSTSVSQFQLLVCPTFRDVYSFPPTAIGRVAAWGELFHEKMLTELPSSISSLYQRAVDFTAEWGALIGVSRNRIAALLLSVTAVASFLFQNAAEALEDPAEALRALPRQIGDWGTSAGDMLYKGVVSIPSLPGKLLSATISRFISVISHKVTLAALSYMGARYVYNAVCSDYETSLPTKETPSLDFMHRTLYEYYKKREVFLTLQEKDRRQAKGAG